MFAAIKGLGKIGELASGAGPLGLLKQGLAFAQKLGDALKDPGALLKDPSKLLALGMEGAQLFAAIQSGGLSGAAMGGIGKQIGGAVAKQVAGQVIPPQLQDVVGKLLGLGGSERAAA